MKAFAILALLLVLALPALAGTRSNNDDTCDIATLPAATLFLPYFEVDLFAADKDAQTTLFTVTNVSNTSQIANVTLWTDRGYPLLSFNLFLTGYDAQSINLRDVLVRGTIANTSVSSPHGNRSRPNGDNPNFLPGAGAACAAPPAPLSPELLAEIRQVLTVGTKSGCADAESARVGTTHLMASGYLTVDLVATCSPRMPNDPAYFDQLLYDNVLTGDYQYVLPNALIGNFASGEPLVHIRAVPEGGAPGRVVTTSLPYTFYDRFTPAGKRQMDRRQPLPSAWAARWIQARSGGFNTDLVIWRESIAAGNATCGAVAATADTPLMEVVRFDERENPTTSVTDCIITCPAINALPGTARVGTTSEYFPPLLSSDLQGWMYVNADNGGSATYSTGAGRDLATGSSTEHGPRPGQSWVTPRMSAEGRYSVSMPATMLANGCSPAPAKAAVIAPGVNATP
jgi:hypothetical protein